MTIHEFSLSKDLEEMDEGDLRSTLEAFMEKHTENVEAYSALEAERDEAASKVEDLEGEIESYTEVVGDLKTKFADIVAAEVPIMTAEEVADRFSLGELIEKADSLGAFSLPAGSKEADEGDEDEPETRFADKPDKAPTGSTEESAFTADAKADLESLLGVEL